MKSITHKNVFVMIFLLPLLFATTQLFSKNNSAVPDQKKQIQLFISKTFDQPNNKVATTPIVVVKEYALADWIQGDKGGRALLRRKNGVWELIACGGDGFKEIETLKTAGIPADIAKELIAHLDKAEQSLSPKLVKKFGLFGAPNDGNMKETPHHPNH